MKTDTTNAAAKAAEGTLFVGGDWFDPLEAGVRTRIRGFIEELLEAELDAALGRDRYERPRLSETGVGGGPVVGAGHRHGHRERQLIGTFGPVTVRVPRARLETSDGKTAEWKNATIPAYQRRTKQADALLIAAPTLPGPTRAGCARRSRLCSAVPLGRARAAEFGAK